MEHYVSDLLSEFEMIGTLAATRGRPVNFVYFGGGTPSLLPLKQIERLFQGIEGFFPWDQAKEISFECAPKTATPDKLKYLRKAGVTRISMGIQQLNDEILRANGRIHSSSDAKRAYTAIANESFPIVNVDLIVGLVAETDDTFFDSLREVIELEPDSVTIYQLEIPPNTPLFKAQVEGTSSVAVPSWDTKRRRLNEAFNRLEDAGYKIRSAYAAVRDMKKHRFVYQEAQYRGVDLIGAGVASFSYVQGVHYQNLASLDPYRASIAKGELPISRGYILSDDDRLVRQFTLQLKLGSVPIEPFQDEFGIHIGQRFAEPLAKLAASGILSVGDDAIRLTRDGLLRVDRILPEFFPPQFQDKTYW
jgi:oxygen-independent coproporphyrinogen-3 oxidase